MGTFVELFSGSGSVGSKGDPHTLFGAPGVPPYIMLTSQMSSVLYSIVIPVPSAPDCGA